MVPRQSTGPILAPPSYIYIIHSSANTACNVYTSVHCVHQCSHQTYKVHRNQVQFGDITAAQATGHGQVIYIWVGITMWSTSTSQYCYVYYYVYYYVEHRHKHKRNIFIWAGIAGSKAATSKPPLSPSHLQRTFSSGKSKKQPTRFQRSAHELDHFIERVVALRL